MESSLFSQAFCILEEQGRAERNAANPHLSVPLSSTQPLAPTKSLSKGPPLSPSCSFLTVNLLPNSFQPSESPSFSTPQQLSSDRSSFSPSTTATTAAYRLQLTILRLPQKISGKVRVARLMLPAIGTPWYWAA